MCGSQSTKVQVLQATYLDDLVGIVWQRWESKTPEFHTQLCFEIGQLLTYFFLPQFCH